MGKNKRGCSSKTVESLLAAKRKKGPVAFIHEYSTRADSIGHWPLFSEIKARCKNPGCDGILRFIVKNVKYICVLHLNLIVFKIFTSN